MRRPYQILYPLLSLFLVRVDLTDLHPLTMKVKVLKVYDGDTLLISQGNFKQKLRLSRIDAPEKGQPFLNGKGDAGKLSSSCLKRLIKHSHTLTLEGHDIYGRMLGELDELSLELLRKGCVSLYPHARFRNKQEKFVFLRTLYEAKQKRRGLWARGGVLEPKLWRKKNKSFFKRRISRHQ